MRRALLVVALSLGVVVTTTTPSLAGLSGAHFNNVTITTDGSTITASGREAGLGDVDQVHIVLTATALCINGGGNHPKAVNKTGVAVGGDFPVQNGHADFRLVGTATFQPACSPPMTVQFTDIVVTDTTTGLSYRA